MRGARLSVVIPTLAEDRAIAGAVRNAFAAGADEVIVADGGSSDRMAEIAVASGARERRARETGVSGGHALTDHRLPPTVMSEPGF